ncbi:hypothetical protein E2562_026592 [Oryza meyeriana var. granulata]|uniref:KIB1-4 beta-propeller domain-containing protein n=1 Tax=Oryza meyeriana var. granulata TaxID=110450 RepID=A0A6G1CSZ7_9ORYZ|nr:hypothetical protein E2562_026592 [Oryza meyeriana var. granulata]
MVTSTPSRQPAAPTLPCLVFDYGETATLYGVSHGVRRPCEAEELRNKRNVLWYCHVDGGGSSSFPSAAAGWAKHEYDLGGTNVRVIGGYHFARRFVSGLTACHGRFYYFHTATKYGVVDFSPAPVFSTVPMKAVSLDDKVPTEETMASASSYTLEIDGELYMAYVFFHGADSNTVVVVGVYRMDFRKRKPVRVRSIGDRAIVAGSSSFCFAGWSPTASSGLRPSSIYWMSPMEQEEGEYIFCRTCGYNGTFRPDVAKADMTYHQEAKEQEAERLQKKALEAKRAGQRAKREYKKQKLEAQRAKKAAKRK